MNCTKGSRSRSFCPLDQPDRGGLQSSARDPQRAVKAFQHRFWKQISEETEQGKQGFPVKKMPASTVIRWLWKKFGIFILLISAVTGALLAPPAVLWTRDMDNGLRAVITCILLFVVSVLIFHFDIIQEIRSRFVSIRELFRGLHSVEVW